MDKTIRHNRTNKMMYRTGGVSHSHKENRNAAIFLPSCYAVRANKALIYAALRARK